MPRAIARIRKRYVDGVTEVLDWQLEEELVFGCMRALGPSFNRLRQAREWAHQWDRWRDVILPKAIEARPGLRPFAMYAAGEIPPRPVLREMPTTRRFMAVVVPEANNTNTTHYLDAPARYVKPEVDHLLDLGIVSRDELQRHHQWMQEANPECDVCPVDRYCLETPPQE